MLWRVLEANNGLPDDAIVCFDNTGKEEEASLRFVRDCAQNWGVNIVWLEYCNEASFQVVSFETADRAGSPFDAIIKQRGGILPNPCARFCSSELKTRTTHRYLRSLGWSEWDTMIGIRADEPKRVARFRAKPHPETKDETVCIPLADAGVSAHEVGDFWKTHPFDLGMPNINGKTMHGNCDLCFLKPGHQILSLIAENPSRANWWADKERNAELIAYGDGGRFRIDRPSYAQTLKYAKNQIDMFDAEEEGISCFCGD